MIWDWGWTWKNIDVEGSEIAIDASEVTNSPDNDTGRYQGTGVSSYLPACEHEVVAERDLL